VPALVSGVEPVGPPVEEPDELPPPVDVEWPLPVGPVAQLHPDGLPPVDEPDPVPPVDDPDVVPPVEPQWTTGVVPQEVPVVLVLFAWNHPSVLNV